MRNLVIAGVVIAVVVFGFIYLSNTQKSQIPSQVLPTSQPESTASAKTTPGYQGKVLAGKSAPFLEFKKKDYEKALSENKVIVLNFYAHWCPICRAEEPAIHEGFNALITDRIIGFRVNFKDSETDKDEEVLAKDFKIPYQHSKIILKNGKEFSRSLGSWDKITFDTEISRALTNSC